MAAAHPPEGQAESSCSFSALTGLLVGTASGPMSPVVCLNRTLAVSPIAAAGVDLRTAGGGGGSGEPVVAL